jgi:hypothetical protein
VSTTARPTAALWDSLLEAGGPAAALDLLERITAGQDWRQPPARPTATGSSWDAAQGPEVAEARHLADWIERSACHPALAAANLQSLAGAEVLQPIAQSMPFYVSGSADLHGSNKNYMKGVGDFSKSNYAGRNFYYGIREHGMGAIMNGMAFYGGVGSSTQTRHRRNAAASVSGLVPRE